MHIINLYIKNIIIYFLFLFIILITTNCSDNKNIYSKDETVSFSSTSRIRGLDPAISGEVSSSLAISKIYEGLLQYDYLQRPYKVIPLLADSLPKISPDGLIYTFTIRPGIYFQDDPCFKNGIGRELVAEDFVYSIKRVADVKNNSSGFWAFNNRILGINEFRKHSLASDVTDYNYPVEGLIALDKYTLQIKLTSPYPQLLYILTMHYSFAVPREAVEYYGKMFVNNPVGTGPYILESWKRNSRIEFTKNKKWNEVSRTERYPEKGTLDQIERGLLFDSNKRLPFVDRIVQYVIDDNTTQWMMFLSGQLDFSGISRDNWDVVITPDKSLSSNLSKRGIQLVTSPTLTLSYLGFNWDDNIVGDTGSVKDRERKMKLRQALSCAYNFDVMNQFMNNRLHPLYGPIPEPLSGHLSEKNCFSHNLNKAKQLLKEAGYTNGVDPITNRRLELTIEVGSKGVGDTKQMMDLMCNMFSKIGVKVTPSYNTWPAFIEKLNRRQAQIYQLGWVADYPDAENFLQLFYSKNESPGPNHSNYINKEFDEFYEVIRTMHDCKERTEILNKMTNLIIADAPWIFLYQPLSFSLVHEWVKNYEPHAFPYGMSKYRSIDLEKRYQWRNKNKEDKINMIGIK